MLWCYSLRTALCETIRYQAKSEQTVRQDLIPDWKIRHTTKLGLFGIRMKQGIQVT